MRKVVKGNDLEFPYITLPSSYWMLNLIDALKTRHIKGVKLVVKSLEEPSS